MDLFDSPGALLPVPLPDGELAWQAQLALPYSNEDIYQRLLEATPWRAETVCVFGKRHLQPRLSAWYGDASYTYSGLRLTPLPWTALLREVRTAVEAACGRQFNSVLLNLYRDERDSMGMHSDDEPELGPAPVIASLSYGATRTLIFKHKRHHHTLRLPMSAGGLLLMSGATQQNWRHGINKSTRPLGSRINLTFRYVG